ncbi:hypothetical protein [Azospirillum brasilense]|uniref:hypothetical protein n=1 Tax=Azospirillum brasilense TaxID=192 RepID=UPI0011EE0DF1|nr:hypothetical protein [Azospirillum brasilense]
MPMRYLRITHPEKTVYDVILPLCAVAISLGAYNLLPIKPALLGDNGILKDIKDVLALLIAFFVAALAAVATFSRPGLDEVMKGSHPPSILVYQHSQKWLQPLTRREFLCYLFGYLSSLSLLLFMVIVAAKIFAPSLHQWISEDTYAALKYVFIAFFSGACGHLFISTLLALYYLTDRINRD